MTSSIRRYGPHERLDSDLRPYAEVQADVDFLFAEHDSLARQYPDQWVAIFGQKVVATDNDYVEVLKLLRSGDFDVRSAIVWFMSSAPQIHI
jgi:hypothetical protein